MTKYREEMNHRWVKNLSVAKRYYTNGQYEKYYRGDEEATYIFPGIKICSAF